MDHLSHALEHESYEQVFVCPTCKTFSSEPQCKNNHNALKNNGRQSTLSKLLANFVSVGYRIVPNPSALDTSSLRSWRPVKQSFICHVCGVESFDATCTNNHDDVVIPKDVCERCSAEFNSVSELLQHKVSAHGSVEVKEEPPEVPTEQEVVSTESEVPAEPSQVPTPTDKWKKVTDKFTQLVLKGTLGMGQYQVMTSNTGFVYPEVQDKEEDILEWDDSIELAVLNGGGSVTSLTKSEEVVVPEVEEPPKEPVPPNVKIPKTRQFFRCLKCDTEFPNAHRLIFHDCPQRDQFPGFQCQFCQRWYIKEQWFMRHLKLHQDLLPLACPQCDANFLAPEELEGHRCKKKVTPKQKEIIDVVPSESSGGGGCGRGKGSGSGKVVLPHYYICQICNISLRSERQLNLHLHIHQLAKANAMSAAMQRAAAVATTGEEMEIPSSPLATEPEAPSTSDAKSPPKQQLHIFECNICALTMRSIEEVRVHLASHASNRLYKCESCNERFATTRNLQQHKCAKVATPVPPRKQPAPKRKAKDPPKQVVGPKVVSKSVDEQVEEALVEHKCVHCGKIFGQAAGLACHMKEHGGDPEGRFQCEKCPMKFKILRNLIVHRAKLH
ncbi:zinc finger protein 594-like [Culex pipiens pallens]|uniref:zinc finger protein 594-like n=1 Tax=Culex pipiens pallens TaxID=42434 RepID=UPI001952B791|nr:zinc finger protein 594-like [Culex pipiens pallens]